MQLLIMQYSPTSCHFIRWYTTTGVVSTFSETDLHESNLIGCLEKEVKATDRYDEDKVVKVTKERNVRSEVLTAASMKMVAFWVVAPCSLV
jgi:hypothetical protein